MSEAICSAHTQLSDWFWIHLFPKRRKIRRTKSSAISGVAFHIALLESRKSQLRGAISYRATLLLLE